MVAVEREASLLMIESKYAEARGLRRLRILKGHGRRKAYELTVLGFDTLTFFSRLHLKGVLGWFCYSIGVDFYLFIHIRGI